MKKYVSCRKHRIVILTSLSAVAFVLNGKNWDLAWNQIQMVQAFAAKKSRGFGGGGGGFGGSSKSSNKKKLKENIKKQEDLLGMMETITINTENDQSNKKSTTSAESKGPKLDKWGLPFATLEDIFPPLPDSTELNPIDASKHYTLSEIQECIKDHVGLGNLSDVFDDQGLAKIPNQDGSTMSIRLLHRSPPVITLDNFLTAEECQDIQEVSQREAATHRVGSATFQGALSTRTSTSWFCHYIDLPVLISKAHYILGVPLETMEEPQIVRYKGGEEFSWHYDEVPSTQLSNGGQRLATLLVYLTDVPASKGGGTTFRDLKGSSSTSSSLVMQPVRGSALLFFPSFADGKPDDRTLHKSEVLKGTNDNEDGHKWIVQMWTHERKYQALLPAGNSNEAAREQMKETAVILGYK